MNDRELDFEKMDPNWVGGLVKGLAVIECFDESHPKLSVAEVAKMVGITRAAARRSLLTLVGRGYAEYDGKFFKLTVRAVRLGHAFLSSTSTPKILQSYLERLNQKTHESCAAAILDEHEIVHVAWATATGTQAASVSVGTRLPAFCTSLGRVLMSGLDSETLEARLVESNRPQFTRQTVTDPFCLKELIAAARIDGYSLVKDELEMGLTSLAAPIFNSARRIVAAVNISARHKDLNAEQYIKQFLPHLHELQKSVNFLVQ